MNIILRIIGTVLILAVLQDIFFTVLFPSSGHGIIRKPVLKGIWQIFRFLGRMTTGQKRRNVLSYSGPTVITITLFMWFLLLIVGWAMIYKPALGIAIRASSGATDTSWTTAIYYSGYTFTTLGTGDIVPKTGLYQLLAIIEAATGFALISMVITYFQSVYSSLVGRNAFAQGVHYMSRCTGDAAELLAGLADGADLSNVRQQMASMAGSLRQIYQTQCFYPVLRYFHYRESYYALPRILLTTLDAATLLQTALDKERYAYVINSPALDELVETAIALLKELVSDIQLRSPTQDTTAMWQDRYAAAVAQLTQAGLQVRTDWEAGADEYVNLRTRWDGMVRALAKNMLYEWSAIE